jgi:hypothetical protein
VGDVIPANADSGPIHIALRAWRSTSTEAGLAICACRFAMALKRAQRRAASTILAAGSRFDRPPTP